MKTLLQIGGPLNYGAPGKIAEQIGLLAMRNGWESYMAHGNKYQNPSSLKTFQTVTKCQEVCHEVQSLLFDNHGLASRKETKKLCSFIDEISPDVIHLHNIHGYYLNYQVLFEYLKGTSIPIVWTLHDCWSITGHCSHFDFIGCNKWKTQCNHCPGLKIYPRSLFVDHSKRNYELKKSLFSSVSDRLTLVPVSNWIADFARQSFLSKANIKTIHNGIDIDVFSPQETSDLREKFNLGEKKVILGVASPWTPTKGGKDWIKLREVLPQDKYKLIMIGLNDKQLSSLPEGIIGLGHTNSARELAQYYTLADIFLNTTYVDNFPTVNLEALACGTPVVTYNTGGSPEAIDDNTGIVVEKGNIDGAAKAIIQLTRMDKEILEKACRERTVSLFNKDNCFRAYIDLYGEIMSR